MTKFLHFNNHFAPSVSKAFRKKFQSRTVAADAPSADEIRNLAQSYLADSKQAVVGLNVGVTFLSLKDRYSKKEGRAEAVKRMQNTLLTVRGITLTETHIFVHLEPYKGIALNLRLNRASGFTTVTGEMVGGE